MKKHDRPGFSVNASAFISVFAATALCALLSGCGDSSGSGSLEAEDRAAPVFSSFDLPSDREGAEAYFSAVEEQAGALLEDVRGETDPNRANTVEPLARARKLLSQASNLATAMQADAEETGLRAMAEVWFSRFEDSLRRMEYDETLYKKFVAATSDATEGLTPEEGFDADSLFVERRRLIEPKDIAGFLSLYQELFQLSFQFYLNTQAAPAVITTFTPTELACLPQETLADWPVDEEGNYLYEGRHFTSLMRSCLPEEVRARMFASVTSWAAEENVPLWPRIVELRHEYAKRFGHKDYASSQLEYNMLSTKEEVRDFLDRVAESTDAPFQELVERYREMQREEMGISPAALTAWNARRYAENLRSKEKGRLEVADMHGGYLEHDKTLGNLLQLAGELFGLRFESPLPAPLWNSSIVSLRVFDAASGRPVGTLLYQPFGAKDIAYMLENRRVDPEGVEVTPTVLFTPGLRQGGSETLYLTPADLYNLAHELGHAAHMLLSRRYSGMVFDFLEMPSMFMEHWVRRPDVLLALLSDDPRQPDSSFPEGFTEWWDVSTGSGRDELEEVRYDLVTSAIALDATSWQPGDDNDLGRIARDNLATYYFAYPVEAEPYYNASHLIRPGYDYGYYLYLLGRVAAEDTLEQFYRGGSLSPKEALVYRKIILEEGIFDPPRAFRDFLGREIHFDAFENHYRGTAR